MKTAKQTATTLWAAVVLGAFTLQPAYGDVQLKAGTPSQTPAHAITASLAAPSAVNPRFVLESAEATIKQAATFDAALAHALSNIVTTSADEFSRSGTGSIYLPPDTNLKANENSVSAATQPADANGTRKVPLTEYHYITAFNADKKAVSISIGIRKYEAGTRIEIADALRVYDVALEGDNAALRFATITKKLVKNRSVSEFQ